jgi:hypothetical protein
MDEPSGAAAPAPDSACEQFRFSDRTTYINSFGRILSFGSVFEEFIATELRSAELTVVRRHGR